MHFSPLDSLAKALKWSQNATKNQTPDNSHGSEGGSTQEDDIAH